MRAHAVGERGVRHVARLLLLAAALIPISCHDSDDRLTVTVWHQMPSKLRALLEEQIALFEAQHPDVQVRALYKETEELRSGYQANWRQYPRAMSDSVLYCVHCDKGPAHPTNECEKCGAVFILHLFPKYDEFGSPACPKCDADYGQAAKSKGIDLMPKALNP